MSPVTRSLADHYQFKALSEWKGIAQIGGDLSVTGKLTAASFAGDAAGLSNVTPADNSVTNAKLALDAASLSKVSNEMMVANEANIGIGASRSAVQTGSHKRLDG